MKKIFIIKFFYRIHRDKHVSKANLKNTLLKRDSGEVAFQLILQNDLEQYFCRTPADDSF